MEDEDEDNTTEADGEDATAVTQAEVKEDAHAAQQERGATNCGTKRMISMEMRTQKEHKMKSITLMMKKRGLRSQKQQSRQLKS